MMKFDIITAGKDQAVRDFKVLKGQRILRIGFDDDDLHEIFEDGGGTIYIFGKKLAALERVIRESKRKGTDHGEDGKEEG